MHIPSGDEIYVMWILAGTHGCGKYNFGSRNQHYRIHPHSSLVIGKHYLNSKYVFGSRTCGHLHYLSAFEHLKESLRSASIT